MAEFTERNPSVTTYFGEELPPGKSRDPLADPDADPMSEQDLCDYVVACRTECENRTAQLRAMYTDCENAFLSLVDFSDKEEWQSQVVPPLPAIAVRQIASLLKQSMIQVEDFFDLIPAHPALANLVATFREILKVHLLNEDFPLLFGQAATISAIYGIAPLYIGWRFRRQVEPVVEAAKRQARSPQTVSDMALGRVSEREYRIAYKEKHRGALDLRLVHPRDFYYDEAPTLAKSRWVIEQGTVEVCDLLDLAVMGARLRNLDRVQSVAYDSTRSQDTQRARIESFLQLGEATNPNRRRVRMSYFFGDITDSKGRRWARNAHLWVADDSILVQSCRNPFWTVSAENPYPYTTWSLLPWALRIAGESTIRRGLSLWLELLEQVNVTLDNFKLVQGGIYEVDVGKLDPSEVTEDLVVEPGRAYKTAQPGFINRVPLGEVSLSTSPMIELLTRFWQNVTGVTEFIQGLPTAKGRPTRGEIEIKTAQGSSYFAGIARESEITFIEPTIWQAATRIAQFSNDLDLPGFSEAVNFFGGDAAALTPVVRLALLKGVYKVRARGISAFLERKDLAEALASALKMALSSEDLKARTNIDALWARLFESMGLKTQEFLASKQQPGLPSAVGLGPAAAQPAGPFRPNGGTPPPQSIDEAIERALNATQGATEGEGL